MHSSYVNMEKKRRLFLACARKGVEEFPIFSCLYISCCWYACTCRSSPGRTIDGRTCACVRGDKESHCARKFSSSS